MLPRNITYKHFFLNEEYKEELVKRKPAWANPLAEFTFYRTYAKKKEDGSMETWNECCIRCVEFCFTVMKTHAIITECSWEERKAQRLSQEMCDRMFEFKWMPPGRSLAMAGSEQVYSRGATALNNCAYVCTGNIDTELSKPFSFIMDVSMLGTGCGFSTKGANKVTVYRPEGEPEGLVIEDSREGWVEALSCLIDSYLEEKSRPAIFDYTDIRPEGAIIKGFGGVCSGYVPLEQGLENIRSILENRVGNKLTSSDIVDIATVIAKLVVSGNVRRSALLALGDSNDEEFTTLKDWNKNKVETGAMPPDELKKASKEDYEAYLNGRNIGEIAEKYKHEKWAGKLGGWRWASNNSVIGKPGTDYTEIAKSIANAGEPGVFFLDNAQQYSRMVDAPDNKDIDATGTNPCGEQTLQSYELCCLVETYPSKHEDFWDFQRTLKFAYLYAKVVTLLPTHIKETNDVIKRNRRIGCSMSGIQEAINKFGRRKFLEDFCDKAYKYIEYIDYKYSSYLGIPTSIKKTTVKPSGTVSILAGVASGIHHPESESYFRTVRLSKKSELLPLLQEANYRIEDSVTDPLNTSVVYFPILHEEGTRSKKDVSMWQQMLDAADLQKWWSDNQVSVTVTFNSEESKHISSALSSFEDKLKSVSMLPIIDSGYKQLPMEAKPRQEVEKYASTLNSIDYSTLATEQEDKEANRFCTSDSCQI